MKRISLMAILGVFLISIAFTGCGTEEEENEFKANLYFTNGHSDDINEIVYGTEGTSWTKSGEKITYFEVHQSWSKGNSTKSWDGSTAGYASGDDTEPKEVAESSGSVQCSYLDGVNVEQGTVELEDDNGSTSNTAQLTADTTNHFTINISN